MYKIKVLDFGEAAKGLKLCFNNGNTLLKEAIILYKNKKYRGSAVFSLFAMEEVGKIAKIFNLLNPIDKKDIQKRWKEFYFKEFRSHKKKILDILAHKIIDDIKKTGGKEIRKLIIKKPKKTIFPDLTTLREVSLYVNCDFQKKKFIAPYRIHRDMARMLIKETRGYLKILRPINIDIKKLEKMLSEDARDHYWADKSLKNDTEAILSKFQEIQSQSS